jgi:hypothetical protein
VILSRGDARITPFTSIPAFSAGSASVEEWQARWRKAGLEDLDLTTSSTAPPT